MLDPSSYRMFLWLDWRQGIGVIRVNPTHEVEGGVHPAYEIGSWDSDESNRIGVKVDPHGGVSIAYDLENSQFGGVLTPAISGNILIAPLARGRGIGVGRLRDAFPSLELLLKTGRPSDQRWLSATRSKETNLAALTGAPNDLFHSLLFDNPATTAPLFGLQW